MSTSTEVTMMMSHYINAKNNLTKNITIGLYLAVAIISAKGQPSANQL